MKRLFYIIFMLVVGVFAMAQKKDISQAKEYIKKGVNLDKAELLDRKSVV